LKGKCDKYIIHKF